MTLVFLCSPRPRGVTDLLGEAAASGARATLIKLRERQTGFCRGCGHCLESGACVLPYDGCDEFFELLAAADKVIFAAPVYFYALPGQFKVFIDRSQKFWHRMEIKEPTKKAAVIMAAGRSRGEKLFEGSLLTLRWFLKPFGYGIVDQLLLRGLNNPEDISVEQKELAFDLGRALEKD